MGLNDDGEVMGIGHNFTILNTPDPNDENAMLKVAHQEPLPRFSFILRSSFVSAKYIVTQFIKTNENTEVLVEVRSTADFKVVYSIKERAAQFHCFGFVKDVLAVHMIFQNGRKFIRWNQIILFQLKTGTIYFIIFVL